MAAGATKGGPMGIWLEGKPLADKIKEDVRGRPPIFNRQTGKVPGLAAVLVGDNKASQVYVRSKEKACQALGLFSEVQAYPGDITQALARGKDRRAQPPGRHRRHPGPASPARPDRFLRHHLPPLARQGRGRAPSLQPGHDPGQQGRLPALHSAGRHGASQGATRSPSRAGTWWSSAAASWSASRWRPC